MRIAESSTVEELADQCLSQGLIDEYKPGKRVEIRIGDTSFLLKPRMARKVLSAILRELGVESARPATRRSAARGSSA